jgi:CRP-like cAMP-binding protein
MGQPIFNTDQPGADIYIVVEGEAAILQNGDLVQTLNPGEFLDERVTANPYSTAIAKTNCYLVPIDQQIRTVLEQYPPHFRIEAIRVMVERLTWRVSPPFKLAVPPLSRPLPASPTRTRAITDTFNITAAVGY